jgi:hypothetical protein
VLPTKALLVESKTYNVMIDGALGGSSNSNKQKKSSQSSISSTAA